MKQYGEITLADANKVDYVTAIKVEGGYRIEALVNGKIEILKKKSTRIPAFVQVYSFKMNGNFFGAGFGGHCTFSKSVNRYYSDRHLRTIEVFTSN